MTKEPQMTKAKWRSAETTQSRVSVSEISSFVRHLAFVIRHFGLPLSPFRRPPSRCTVHGSDRKRNQP
jgi:hypothetical protein